MKTSAGTTPESSSKFTKTTAVNEHPEIGKLISTLQELSTEFLDTDGDDLMCIYNELMFSKEFKAAIGHSRRTKLVKPLLEKLNIRFEGSGSNYSIYFPRNLSSRCDQANEDDAALGLPIATSAVDVKLHQSPSKDSYSPQWVRSIYKAAGSSQTVYQFTDTAMYRENSSPFTDVTAATPSVILVALTNALLWSAQWSSRRPKLSAGESTSRRPSSGRMGWRNRRLQVLL